MKATTTETTGTTLDTPPYIGIDIGGTTTRIGLFPTLDDTTMPVLADGVDVQNAVNAPTESTNSTDSTRLIVRFPTQNDYKKQLASISEALRSVSEYSVYRGIGVSIGGRIAKNGRCVIVAPNLPDYIGKPFAQELEELFGCYVRLGHDTVCGLLAEKRYGSLQRDERCAYLTISTGTGAAIHLEKAGTGLTSSIEIGHQILDGNTRQCLCGQVGCLETYTGGRQLELRYDRPLSEIIDATFWDTFCEKLALGLLNLTQLTRIDTVAISGAIALHNPFVIPTLQANINAMLRGSTLELRVATLGENAPLIGAALLLDTPEETILH